MSTDRRFAIRVESALPIAALLVAWYLVTHIGVTDPVFLPSPGRALRSFVSLFSVSFFRDELAPSLVRIGGAFLLSVAVAFPLGVLSGQIPLVARLVLPLCGFTRYLPVAALVPLCILWFGIGDAQKIADHARRGLPIGSPSRGGLGVGPQGAD